MGRISASVAGRSRIRRQWSKCSHLLRISPPGRSLRAVVEVVAGAATRRGICERLGRVRRVVRTRSRDNIAGGVSDGGRLSRLHGDVEIAGSGADGRAHQRNRRRAGLTITVVIAGPQPPRRGDYRGSVERISASARAAVIAGPQRRGDYRGSVERCWGWVKASFAGGCSWWLATFHGNSLFAPKNSLFREKNSLFRFVGNIAVGHSG
jgi:hypothetical protein